MLDKLASNGFKLGEFINFLSSHYEFYDGTASQALAITVHPQANALWGQGATIADIFGRTRNNRRTSAITSIISSYFLAFFNPDDISTNRRGVNDRNLALLFHEGIHGYYVGINPLFDQDLMRIFGLSGPSGSITDYIQRNCF